jgi:hypothetical protein
MTPHRAGTTASIAPRIDQGAVAPSSGGAGSGLGPGGESEVREELPDDGGIVQCRDQPQPAPAVEACQNTNRERPVHERRPAPGARTALRLFALSSDANDSQPPSRVGRDPAGFQHRAADLYIAYVENRHGEQWLFTFNRATRTASLGAGTTSGWRSGLPLRSSKGRAIGPLFAERRARDRPGTRRAGIFPAAGAPLVPGNSIRVLKDASEYYPAWLDAIAGAKRSIHFESYIIHDDSIGATFSDTLIAKLRDGVRVWVIYDWRGAGRRRGASGVDCVRAAWTCAATRRPVPRVRWGAQPGSSEDAERGRRGRVRHRSLCRPGQSLRLRLSGRRKPEG